MERTCNGLEIEQRLEKDADGSYERTLLALLDDERQRVEGLLAVGAPVEEYRNLERLAEGLSAARLHLQALAARRRGGTGFPGASVPAGGASGPATGPGGVYKLLIELGFSAAFRGLTEPGAKMFAAGRVLRPAEVHPLLGEAVIRLQKLELPEAASLLEEVNRREPENKLVQGFSNLCSRLLRQLSEGRGALGGAVGNSPSGVAAGLAQPR